MLGVNDAGASRRARTPSQHRPHGGASARLPDAVEHAGSNGCDIVDIRVDGQLYRCVALTGRASRRFGSLTEAELDVAQLAVGGHSAQAIAARRGTSSRTVHHQLGSIFRKLGICSRNELCALLDGDS